MTTPSAGPYTGPASLSTSLQRFGTTADVARLVGCSQRSVQRMVRLGLLPPPSPFSRDRWSRWWLEDVAQHLRSGGDR